MINTQELQKALYFQNPWWIDKKTPLAVLPDFIRPVFYKIQNYLETIDRVIVIKGPRRTGKTTLMYQTIDALIKKGVNPLDIVFISFDDPELSQLKIGDIFSSYEKIRQSPFNEGKIYCFLDEVHFSNEWQLYVKKYFDRKYAIKFIVSSSSASLFKKGLESLAGRTIEETVFPFNFSQFILFNLRGDKNFQEFFTRDRIVSYENKIKILFDLYLKKGGFPYIVSIEEPLIWSKLLKEDIVEKVIYRDLTKLYGIREPQKMEAMFNYLADISGQILNINNLSKTLNLSRVFSENYFTYLEQSYLVFRLRNFSLSASKKARSAAKAYLTDSGLINIFGNASNDFVLESTVAKELFQDKNALDELYYYRDSHEIDLILKKEKSIIPIEIKNKDEISNSDAKNVSKFMEENNIKKGIILSTGKEEIRKTETREILIIPVWKFLLFKEDYLN